MILGPQLNTHLQFDDEYNEEEESNESDDQHSPHFQRNSIKSEPVCEVSGEGDNNDDDFVGSFDRPSDYLPILKINMVNISIMLLFMFCFAFVMGYLMGSHTPDGEVVFSERDFLSPGRMILSLVLIVLCCCIFLRFLFPTKKTEEEGQIQPNSRLRLTFFPSLMHNKDTKESFELCDDLSKSNSVCDEKVKDRANSESNIRLVVSEILGSIGAPPLPLMEEDDGKNDNKEDHKDHPELISQIKKTKEVSPSEKDNFNCLLDDLLIELLSAHSALLSKAANCIHAIKIGSALSLGLGPSSLPFVPRVEDASVGRVIRARMEEKKEMNQTGSGKGKKKSDLRHPLCLRDARTSLFRILCNQEDYLLSILLFFSTSYHEQQQQEPTYITLSDMSIPMQSSKAILTKISSSILRRESQQQLKHTILQLIKQSVNFARESVAYLEACFEPLLATTPLSSDVSWGKKQRQVDENNVDNGNEDTINDNNENNTEQNPHSPKQGHWTQQKKKLLQMNQCLEAAFVSIWAFGKETMTYPSASQNAPTDEINDTEQNSCDSQEENDRLREEWLVHLRSLLLDAIVMRDEIHDEFLEYLKNKKDQNVDVTNPNCDVPKQDNDENGSKKSELLLYEDMGGGSEIAVVNKDGEKNNGRRTLVFSGNGSMVPPKLSEKKKKFPSKRREDGSDLSEILDLHMLPSQRSGFLRDLRNRIDAMDLFPEEDEQQEEEQELANVEKAKNIVQESPLSSSFGAIGDGSKASSPFFLGASGSLLSELKGVIVENETNDENDGDSYVCVKTDSFIDS